MGKSTNSLRRIATGFEWVAIVARGAGEGLPGQRRQANS